MSIFVQIGFNNMVVIDKIEAIANPDSAPIRRSIQEHREAGTLIDMTFGRKTKSVIFMTSGSLVLSMLASETIKGRSDGKEVNNKNIDIE